MQKQTLFVLEKNPVNGNTTYASRNPLNEKQVTVEKNSYLLSQYLLSQPDFELP